VPTVPIVPTARALVAATLAWLLAGPAFAALDPGTLIKLSTSVLKVEVIRAQGGYSLGSGVVVGADAVVTNCHVTRDARLIAVLQGGVRLPAQSQRVDAYHDLCLLRVRGIDGARAVELAEAAIGQAVTAVGHTSGALQSSTGEVLALHRLDGGRVIRSTNYFNSGASGGGLFDTESRLVGILSFRLRGATGHYFAMPTEWLARQLRDAQDEQPVAPRSNGELAFWEQPLESQPFFLRAAVLENDGDWRALQPLAAEWARHDVDDPEPWYLLGIALDRQNLPGEARHALECSLALAPDFASARTELEQLSSRRDLPERSAPSAPCRL
jgi:serine protease Do